MTRIEPRRPAWRTATVRALTPALALLLLVMATGCAGDGGVARGETPAVTHLEIGKTASTGEPAATTTTAYVPTTLPPPPDVEPERDPTCPAAVDSGTYTAGNIGRTPSTTEPKPSSTTAPPPSRPPAATDPKAEDTTSTTIVDPRGAVAALRADPRLAGTKLSVSVWEEGRGEAAADDPDALLVPASNQKLITAMGALTYLRADDTFTTDVVATGPIVDGVLHGDLVVIGGGDPVITRSGPHSIDGLAQQIAGTGLTAIEGRILVDEGRYDTVRTGPNWPSDWLYSIGPMSAFAVDHDMFTKDRGYVDDPARGNGEVLKFALTVHGVRVAGNVEHGRAETGVRLARLESPTVKDLLAMMLFTSDNFIAETFAKEIAFRVTKQSGTTAAGVAAIHRAIARLCVPVAGIDVDGSGLSRDNRRSAREFRRLLQVAALQPWGELFVSSLSIAGEEGALGGRLAGPVTAGRVRAKGGLLFVARTLSGYLTTAEGRHVVFSVLVNGQLSTPNHKVEDAVDDLLTNLVRLG